VGVGTNRTGAFAEFLVIPAGNAFPLPDSISDDVASVLDPLGNAAHTALSFDLVGEDVLITGAGPIGCMASAIARHVGARYVVVTDVNDYRLGLAMQMGATRVLNAKREDVREAMGELDMREGFDVGMEMSGAGQAFRDLLATMNHGGKVAILGIPPNDISIDWNQVIFKGLMLKGVYGREMFETWYKMTTMLESGLDVGPVITHHFPYTEYQEAFEVMRSGQSGKVILDWTV
jgi:threonine 3-dehydrogenase